MPAILTKLKYLEKNIKKTRKHRAACKTLAGKRVLTKGLFNQTVNLFQKKAEQLKIPARLELLKEFAKKAKSLPVTASRSAALRLINKSVEEYKEHLSK